jgi:hypothetical protein
MPLNPEGMSLSPCILIIAPFQGSKIRFVYKAITILLIDTVYQLAILPFGINHSHHQQLELNSPALRGFSSSIHISFLRT